MTLPIFPSPPNPNEMVSLDELAEVFKARNEIEKLFYERLIQNLEEQGYTSIPGVIVRDEILNTLQGIAKLYDMKGYMPLRNPWSVFLQFQKYIEIEKKRLSEIKNNERENYKHVEIDSKKMKRFVQKTLRRTG